jgi:hypothetical protein
MFGISGTFRIFHGTPFAHQRQILARLGNMEIGELMNEQGNWNQLSSENKRKWAKVTDDDLAEAEGTLGRLKERLKSTAASNAMRSGSSRGLGRLVSERLKWRLSRRHDEPELGCGDCAKRYMLAWLFDVPFAHGHYRIPRQSPVACNRRPGSQFIAPREAYPRSRIYRRELPIF